MADGDCFVVAFHHVVFDDPDNDRLRLIHAKVVGQGDIDGVIHDHAWVEESIDYTLVLPDIPEREYTLTTVTDKSNGNDISGMPAVLYRKIGQAHDVRYYTADEARILAMFTGHYGPWEEDDGSDGQDD